MEKIEEAVFDTGPLIHLAEIDQLSLLEIVKEKTVPEEVYNEFKKHRQEELGIGISSLNEKAKKYARLLVKEYYIDLGEAEAIALLEEKDLKYFFTDDWYAREVAEGLDMNVHGTLGIITRSFRKCTINKSKAFTLLDKLLDESSLFVTPNIVSKAKTEIKRYDNK